VVDENNNEEEEENTLIEQFDSSVQEDNDDYVEVEDLILNGSELRCIVIYMYEAVTIVTSSAKRYLIAEQTVST